MGDGLKRVAKMCGGLTAKDKRGTVKYNGDGEIVSKQPTVQPIMGVGASNVTYDKESPQIKPKTAVFDPTDAAMKAWQEKKAQRINKIQLALAKIFDTTQHGIFLRHVVFCELGVDEKKTDWERIATVILMYFPEMAKELV